MEGALQWNFPSQAGLNFARPPAYVISSLIFKTFLIFSSNALQMSKKALYRALLIRVQRPAVICSTRTDYQQNNSSHNWTTKICPDKFVIEMLKKRWVFSSDDLMLTEKILMIVRNEFQNRFNNLIERLSLQRDFELNGFEATVGTFLCFIVFFCSLVVWSLI